MRILLCFFFLIPNLATNQSERLRLLEAGFVYNFARFITWEEKKEKVSPSYFHVCVYTGESSSWPVFERALHKKKVKDFEILVTPVYEYDFSLKDSCHILWIDPNLNRPKMFPLPGLLVVGEGNDFIANGGQIHLIEENNRLRFEIDLLQIQKNKMSVSSKMLRLGRILP